MDPGSELAFLASTAATEIVKSLATDSWPALKAAVLKLWRKAHPERVADDLAEARSELLEIRKRGRDGTELNGVLVAEWQARLARLLIAQPEVADELRALLQRMASDTPSAGQGPSVTITTHVQGGGDAYVAGRDQTINR
jgi:hypothetical protein